MSKNPLTDRGVRFMTRGDKVIHIEENLKLDSLNTGIPYSLDQLFKISFVTFVVEGGFGIKIITHSITNNMY